MGESEPPPNVPLLYVNWVGAQPGPVDLAIDFGYQPPNVAPQPGVRVVVTWQYAKLIRDFMNAVIEQRESNVGTIELPEGVGVVHEADEAPEPPALEAPAEEKEG